MLIGELAELGSSPPSRSKQMSCRLWRSSTRTGCI